MKIRTITTGITFHNGIHAKKIEKVVRFNQMAKEYYEHKGYEVQTTRIATNSWETYFKSLRPNDIFDEVNRLENLCHSLNVNFFNIGYSKSPDFIQLIPQIISGTPIISCSTKIGDRKNGINEDVTRASAEVIKRISEMTENGLGNFQYCAWANCPPNIPFFPAAFHEGNSSFSIGLECSDLVMKAFSHSKDLNEASQQLEKTLHNEFSDIAAIAEKVAKKFNVPFRGVDTSIAPSLDPNESIAYAFEKLGIEKFGQAGTLTVSSLITHVIKELPVKSTGFCGLMLPVCEDYGLAKRVSQGVVNLSNLLLYSSVCGTGLDTVPIPGDTTIEKIEAILWDVASLAIRLNKPLSARLLPAPGKKAGDMTSFNSPYLVECRIMTV